MRSISAFCSWFATPVSLSPGDPIGGRLIRGTVRNLTRQREIPFESLLELMKKIVTAGGVVPFSGVPGRGRESLPPHERKFWSLVKYLVTKSRGTMVEMIMMEEKAVAFPDRR